jgi:hypothetical protein
MKSMKLCFKDRKTIQNHFLHSGHLKKRLVRSSWSHILDRQMALRTHNLSSRRRKERHWLSRWTQESRRRKAMRTNFVDPGHWKKQLGRCRLSDVLSRWMAQRTFILPPICLKRRLVKSMKRCFKVTKCHAKSFSASWASKNRLGRSGLSDDLSGRMALRNHNLLPGRLKKRNWCSMKHCFKLSKGPAN